MARQISDREAGVSFHTGGRLNPFQDIGKVLARHAVRPECLDRVLIRLALEPAAPFRYANHSCDPNCELCSWEETEGDITPDRVWFTALRAIQPGEELTIDYAWEADAAIPCGCGSANCRGWIVDEADLEEVLRRHNPNGRRRPTADRTGSLRGGISGGRSSTARA